MKTHNIAALLIFLIIILPGVCSANGHCSEMHLLASFAKNHSIMLGYLSKNHTSSSQNTITQEPLEQGCYSDASHCYSHHCGSYAITASQLMVNAVISSMYAYADYSSVGSVLVFPDFKPPIKIL